MSEQKILLISGKKQSGKDSAANYLAGHLLKKYGIIQYFELDEEGKLLIDIEVDDPVNGGKVKELGLLDLNRRDMDCVKWFSTQIWPLIKIDHFGDTLKDVVCVVFNLDREKLWGSDADKNELTHIKWSDIYKICPQHIPKVKEEDSQTEETSKSKKKRVVAQTATEEFLTYRQVLEVFGTDICRTIYSECWIQSLFKNVVLQNYPFVVVPDCRNPDEVEYARAMGAKVVRLTRNPHDSKTNIETALDDYTDFDFVIDNQNMTQEQKGVELVKWLQELGWI